MDSLPLFGHSGAVSDRTEPASGAPDAAVERLVEELVGEMNAAWRRGERLPAEALLARNPDLAAAPEIALRLINEELCLREEAGEQVPSTEIRRRFPQWHDRLDVLIHCHRLLADPIPPGFPEAGESLGEFRLLSELGRGALGRVFLARQPSLAERLVVLKVIPLSGAEHLLLSRLQHTHIVPVYSVEEHPERGVQAFCMPWLGGATLSRLLAKLKDFPAATRRGSDLLEALDVFRAPRTFDVNRPTPAREFLASATYSDAVCWIGACLADALEYVHQHGLVHLDLKPSNVLLTADGQPMLLDFHLASERLIAGMPPPRGFGGTPGYMAPEQQQAMAAARRGGLLAQPLDHRADLYALGIVLHEALSGLPTDPARCSLPRLDKVNPQVSRGLGDIIGRCLASDPDRRYGKAAELADDLRRHFQDRLLRGVRNRSLRERWRKWRRRQPGSAAVVALALLAAISAAAVGGFGWNWVRERRSQAESALVEARARELRGDFAGAEEALRRAETLLDGLPLAGELRPRIQDEARRAAAGRSAAELHEIVERLRFAGAMEDLPPQALESMSRTASMLWYRRNDLHELATLTADAGALRRDLHDLGILHAALTVRVGPAADARRKALTILDEAEALAGESLVLLLERKALYEALGETDAAGKVEERASRLQPWGAWEHSELGRLRLQNGDFEAAAAYLRHAVDERPDAFWPRFQLGVCLLRLDRPDEAVHCFDVCIALRPGQAECYYNRALAHAALGASERAIADDTRALALESGLTPALVHRARLHLARGDGAAARADLESAILRGGETADVRFMLAQLDWRARDARRAREQVQRALSLDRTHAAARNLDRLIRRAE